MGLPLQHSGGVQAFLPVQRRRDPAAEAVQRKWDAKMPFLTELAMRPDRYDDIVQRAAAAGCEIGSQPSDDAGKAVTESEYVHRTVAAGVSGSGGVLPHLDRIQPSFGPHRDVSHIRAHVGGAAADASEAIGASAYATGARVAFRSAPDLHTAAHEAAHVIQQQQGVQLQGGVGQVGDVYERHADAVADRVVAGQSAAALLAAGPTGSAPVSAREQSAPGNVQNKAVQRDSKKDAAGKDSSGPKLTHSTSTTFELGLTIPIYGPLKFEGKISGSYAQKSGSDGPKTEVEGMLYGGVLADLVFLKLSVGVEGKIKFTVAGHQDILAAVEKGIKEIAQWRIAKNFQPRLKEAKGKLQSTHAEKINNFNFFNECVNETIQQGDFKSAGAKGFFLLPSYTPRALAMDCVKGWNSSLKESFKGLGAEIDQSRLPKVNKLEVLFDRIRTANDKATAKKYAKAVHKFGIFELERTYKEASEALDQINVVSNDPSVGFEASVAFKAGVALQANSTTNATIEAALVSSIKDDEGKEQWDTSTKTAEVVSGKLPIGDFEVGLVGDWKKKHVEIALSVTENCSTAAPEEAENSLSSLFGAVQGSTFKKLTSPLATTKAIASQIGKLVADQTKALTDPKKIAERLKGKVDGSQSLGVEVKLKFKRDEFTLVGGSVKFTYVMSKVDAKKALGAAARVGVSGSVSAGTSIEMSWGE
ncbi:DUF4157 domain-containing protein [Haliangium sp.]|uniref:eCIS core domain-containing protein n=1 Tax=Haliangium sp. TaxID=2663208 RepID=UPI003D0ADFF7